MTNILDSSLISPTKTLKKYNTKIIQCGDYIQLYFYSNDKKIETDKEFNKTITDLKRDLIIPIQNNKARPKPQGALKKIDIKNITRSKINCQLLAKANIQYWKTFITLTYSDNINDIELSRKHFRYFIDIIRRIKKDFRYLCITEFQKRGAIHYHLLTNIDLSDTNLIYYQHTQIKKKIKNKEIIKEIDFPHIKYWNYGFNSVEVIEGNIQKIVGYISKYMTKDIDSRLFSKRRYLYSLNLCRPIVNRLDIGNKKEYLAYVRNLTPDFDLSYSSIYINRENNSPVLFFELLRRPNSECRT